MKAISSDTFVSQMSKTEFPLLRLLRFPSHLNKLLLQSIRTDTCKFGKLNNQVKNHILRDSISNP